MKEMFPFIEVGIIGLSAIISGHKFLDIMNYQFRKTLGIAYKNEFSLNFFQFFLHLSKHAGQKLLRMIVTLSKYGWVCGKGLCFYQQFLCMTGHFYYLLGTNIFKLVSLCFLISNQISFQACFILISQIIVFHSLPFIFLLVSIFKSW